MMSNGKEKKYEVKTDFLAKTGNIFVETECYGKPSGVCASEANTFIFYFPQIKEMWSIGKKKLISLIENNPFKLMENCGDKGSNTKGFLVPRLAVFESFVVSHLLNQNLFKFIRIYSFKPCICLFIWLFRCKYTKLFLKNKEK